MRNKRIIGLIVCAVCCLTAVAGQWTTHFAYNNVTQIAMGEDEVYAISDGSLFSVNKQTEHIRIYNSSSGLHATGIHCIHYDKKGKQLIICYETGKIDMLSSRGTQYIGELYDKDMTQRKTIYNVTLQGRTAYLSTAYGIQTLDLHENKLVDSYWLRPAGQEIDVKDVLISGDSIYAFTDDSLFCASMRDNLPDYRVWKREVKGRISPDEEKGVHYKDETSDWYRGYAEGIVRYPTTGRVTYKPQGPMLNQPYRMTASQGMVYIVPGGRWASQYNNPGCVMRYDGEYWLNIPTSAIKAVTNKDVLDFMNVAVDPNDRTHFYVTSYGTGLYEFRNDELISHTSANEVIESAVKSNPDRYTRLDNATYDAEGRLWITIAGEVANQLAYLDKQGEWHGLPMTVNGVHRILNTPAGLVMDRFNSKRLWIGSARVPTALFLQEEERCISRSEWTDQKEQHVVADFIHALYQDRSGRVLIGTESGIIVIDRETDFFTSDRCFRPDITVEDGSNPFTTLVINDITDDDRHQIWIGTAKMGVYVLSAEMDRIKAHYTTDNSLMPSNTVMSLAYDSVSGHIWIGTAEGLVEYDPEGHGEGLDKNEADDASNTEMGSMMQWKLHFSYFDPTELTATPQRIFAAASGSLFSVDRKHQTIEYWNKSTGLSGSSVTRIAYDSGSGRLIIAYENGTIDLLCPNGEVISMPDLSIKAGSTDVRIQDICIGSHAAYLAMPFGIVALNAKRGEVTDTYYIGADAAAVDVQQVVEFGDSLYAFAYDRVYKAALRDNLVDYMFWHYEELPREAEQAAVWKDHLYTLMDCHLYRYNGGHWLPVCPESSILWMNAHDGQLLAYTENGLFRLTDEEQLSGLSSLYQMNNALYSDGEYWVAETDQGLIRLGTQGDEHFIPEGPLSNFGYKLHAAHNQVYVAPGGRWAEQFGRQSSLSIYDGQSWRGIPWPDTWYYTDHDIRDAVSYAVDTLDPGHFFVATYGTGVFEFKDYRAVTHYDKDNSTLRAVNATSDDYYYTRTDGAMTDNQGNLWVLNATSVGSPIHVRTPNGQWRALKPYCNGVALEFNTPGGIMTDRRDSRFKWMFDQRQTQGVILLNDAGTPTNPYDDYCVKRNTWVDQNGNILTPSSIVSMAQDMNNRLWIGTDKGVMLIPADVDFFTSKSCKRIIIPRNDGTGLGDYLLGDERINCLAVDGGNRMWIGTENSGLYLIEDDTITVAHFTETNSLLPSNSIQSIAILPFTGEVFVGTDNGIASYRSDASEPQEDMKGAYAYPNPVRPNYSGVVSITGLMDNSEVRIVDAGGNLVCRTRSHGGTAVWDLRLVDGRRATPGVYTAFCNAVGGHTVVKILVAY